MDSSNNNNPSEPRFNICYVAFAEARTAGQGHVTRALAISNALDRAGLLWPIGPVGMWLAGQVDNPALWPDPDRLIPFSGDVTAFCDRLGQGRFDIMLLDNVIGPVIPLISPISRTQTFDNPNWEADKERPNPNGWEYQYRPDRPTQVWYLSRHMPHAFGSARSVAGFPMQSLDRHYLLEPHMLYENGWQDEYVRQLPRSNAQRAAHASGELGPAAGEQRAYQAAPNFQEFMKNATARGLDWHAGRAEYQALLDEQGYVPMPQYLLDHHKPGWKLLAPVVNIDSRKIYDRQNARFALCSRFSLDPNRPIALIVGRTRYMSETDQARFVSFKAELEARPDSPQVVAVGGNGSGHGEYLPEAYRYYPGLDYLLIAAGYNAFWEARYLIDRGLFTGRLGVVGHQDANNDQLWRAGAAGRGALDNQHYWSYAAFQPPSEFDNGADELAYLVGRNLGLVNPAEVAG